MLASHDAMQQYPFKQFAHTLDQRKTPMLTQIQTDISEFLKTEANAAVVRACSGGSTADANIAEAQELLALRARMIARAQPSLSASQLELPFFKKAA